MIFFLLFTTPSLGQLVKWPFLFPNLELYEKHVLFDGYKERKFNIFYFYFCVQVDLI